MLVMISPWATAARTQTDAAIAETSELVVGRRDAMCEVRKEVGLIFDVWKEQVACH